MPDINNLKQEVVDSFKSAKFKGVSFDGDLALAEDNTLDINLNVRTKANVNLPGDSELMVINIWHMLKNLGNSKPALKP